jgi:hypothetical protein
MLDHYHPMDPLPRSDTGPFLSYDLFLLKASTSDLCLPQPVLVLGHAPFPLVQTSFEPNLYLSNNPSNLDPVWAQNPDSNPIQSLSLHN